MKYEVIDDDPVAAFNAIYRLPDRLQRIVSINYFFNRMSVRDIAVDLNVSAMTVSRIKAAALRELERGLNR